MSELPTEVTRAHLLGRVVQIACWCAWFRVTEASEAGSSPCLASLPASLLWLLSLLLLWLWAKVGLSSSFGRARIARRRWGRVPSGTFAFGSWTRI